MAASLPIPVFTNLEDLYQNLGTSLNHAERWDNLSKEFKARFGRAPAYIARAPGRLTRVPGEHIDYQLFGCFPAAIEHDILIACAPRSPTGNSHGDVVAENLYPKYTRQGFAPVRQWHLDINRSELRWESYVKAGYYGVLNHYFAPGETEQPIPVDLLVTGSVPPGSGLSSSAAMVVGSTLAFLAVNGLVDDSSSRARATAPLNKGSLVEMAMENEKRVGVNSGGMDQAASVIALANSALYISFFPKLAAETIPLPGSSTSGKGGAVFICANSLVVSDKAVHAKTRYNLRVVETLAAARILARRLGVKVGPSEKITLRTVMARLLGEPEDAQSEDVEVYRKGLERMAKEVECLRPEGKKDGEELGVTMETMVEWSGLDKVAFEQVYLSWVEVEATHFQLYKRAKHVYEEALRVLQFRDVCLAAASSGTAGPTVFQQLGDLMSTSHVSCSSMCECSCPELDELTAIALKAGAYGSRVTGAGWGGCTVSLVDEDKVDEFIAKVKAAYGPYKNLEGGALRDVIFATKPSSGACGEYPRGQG
ncbi:galactokinase gal [Coniophora puteana RWD-64-598 SS2]|uniref:Galactokinase n=1 Tax=Coniophora puteana (strain RWD-64-598) TaxID=741705 RepID=A0A5M3MZN6_CONPW|nr:galactokinase gal [Coniophora puteana RWD-64-598 SS2]EIW84610.1 galactokinase gal [Coniophora puteana RWD-64-598 SS2]